MMFFKKIKSTSHCVLDIRSDGATLLHEACGALGSKGNSSGVFNSLPWERHEIIQSQDGTGKPGLGMLDIYSIYVDALQTTTAFLMLGGICCSAALVRAPSIGLSPVKDTRPVDPVSVTVQVCTIYREHFINLAVL